MDLVFEIPNNLSPKVCEDMIKRFEKDDRKSPGVTGDPDNKLIKHSTDLGISDFDDWKDVDDYLHAKLAEGLVKYEQLLLKKGVGDDRISQGYDTGFQIQKTVAGGFYSWHHDYSHNRVITFIWYLNTLNSVTEGGGTAFHPVIGGGGKVINPEQGKLVLFPATWTYTHAGLPLVTDLKNKYICTGWIHLDQ